MKKLLFLVLLIPLLFACVATEEPPAPATYSVTYVINGHGTQPDKVTGVTTIPSDLPVLTEEGWNFDGWFIDSAFDTGAVEGATIKADTTLYAKWTEKSTPKDKTLQTVYDNLKLPNVTMKDLELPTNKDGVALEWSSNKEDVLSPSGKINRGREDETVTLTVKLTYKGEVKEKKFDVVVKASTEDVKYNINYTTDYDFKMDESKAKSFPYYKGYLYPGLLNIDGSEHKDFKENKTTGKRINVKMFGAKPNQEDFDNTKAFENAISSAEFGDEVFVPKGKYYFSTATITYPYYAHIQLKEGVNLIGEGKEESILVSNFSNGEYVHATYGKKTTTLAVGNMSNSTISNLGFTANTDDSCLPADYNNTTANNPKGNAFAPAFGISVYNTSSLTITQNIYIHDVYIEYFQYDGIRLFCTRDCKIADSIITKATDLGGGGAGYGIELRGYGHEYFNFVGTNQDCCYNIITGVKVVGPYIRHGIILSYVTHNNLFYNNDVRDTADDAYDVHGQDEFLNMFVQNYAYGSRKGAGLGLGNTGSSHDESGYGNVLYENTFVKCKYGVTVARGTQYTQLIRNEIRSCQDGIVINDGPNTYKEDNKITK